MADPIIIPGNFNLTLPVAGGDGVGTMTATDNPVSWSIIAGDPGGYYAIDNSGNITVTSAGAIGIIAGKTVLTLQALGAVTGNTGQSMGLLLALTYS
jgi:hypothetical protein